VAVRRRSHADTALRGRADTALHRRRPDPGNTARRNTPPPDGRPDNHNRSRFPSFPPTKLKLTDRVFFVLKKTILFSPLVLNHPSLLIPVKSVCNRTPVVDFIARVKLDDQVFTGGHVAVFAPRVAGLTTRQFVF